MECKIFGKDCNLLDSYLLERLVSHYLYTLQFCLNYSFPLTFPQVGILKLLVIKLIYHLLCGLLFNIILLNNTFI